MNINKHKYLDNFILAIILICLCIYPLVAHVMDRGFDWILGRDIERHQNILEGKSIFFNPWQYRILSAYLLEIFVQGFKFFLSEKKAYLFAFLGFRFLEHLFIYISAIIFYKKFTQSKTLIYLALMVLAFSMSHSTFGSDLSYNTYLGLLFYLLAANVIFSNLNNWWILVLSILAAFNRESGIVIPLLLLAQNIDFKQFKIKNKQNIIISGISIFTFILVFFGLRMHYGFVENEVFSWSEPFKWLKFNFTNHRVYYFVFGTIGILPFLLLGKFKNLDIRLKLMFYLIVPIWFFIHYTMVAAWESRVFLVPVALVFIPCVIDLIQKEISSNYASQ